MLRAFLVSATAFCLLCGPAALAQCTVPNSFTNGLVADADQVNANFSALTTCAAPLASPAFTGFVGVGTATSGGWSSAARMEVYQSANSVNGVSAYVAGTTSRAVLARVDNTNSELSGFFYINGQVGSITTNGTATAYNTSSDARLKSQVVDLPVSKALLALRAYHPQEYLLRGRDGVGALAQDVDRRMSAAGLDAASLGVVTRGDADRSLREGQPGFRQWSMDSAKMVPFIIAASLDHEERLKALEAENTDLARQVRDLARTVAVLERRGERHAAIPGSRAK